MAMTATSTISCSVYYGPSSSLYASVGSIGLNEEVTVHAYEDGWYLIDYTAGAKLKRGFVPESVFSSTNDFPSVSPVFNGSAKTVLTSTVVYTGPSTTAYATAGSVSAGEPVTAYFPLSGNFTYIEYGTSSGTKRGYVLSSQLGNSIGKLAKIIENCSVYYGPAENYVISGSLSLGENCVIISSETPFGSSSSWCQVEYVSGSSRKRGYIRHKSVVPFGSISVPLISTVHGTSAISASQTVYTGPSNLYTAAGSVSPGELVQTLGTNTDNTSYQYIEYATSTGKKRGYVPTHSISETVLFPHTMLVDSMVYAGPSETIYANIGSVSANERVHAVAVDDGWIAIDYVALTHKKRGYVHASSIANSANLLATLSEVSHIGYLDSTTSNQTVFTGPSNEYAVTGSLAANETLTVFTNVGTYRHIEYSTPSGTKRGYILASSLAENQRGTTGKVTSGCIAYSGASVQFIASGSVFTNEYVVVLDRETENKYSEQWYYAEFNSASGRKRGFINQLNVELIGSSDNLEELKHGKNLATVSENTTVYSGPGNAYAVIGSVNVNERVSVYENRAAENSYSFIEYCTPMGAKMGYVPSSVLQATALVIPTPQASVASYNYGYSSNGRTLKYYRVGSGNNALAMLFAVHGYEDAWAADGLELVKLANQLIQTLSVEITSPWFTNWSVYIFPAVNPDGILDGYTCNGPGRTTLGTSVDLNRCFPVNFSANYGARNYTGASPLSALEATALKYVLEQIRDYSATMRLLDIHGWLNTSYGEPDLCTPFSNQFGFGIQSLVNGKGYISRWALSAGIPAALIELPYPNSIADIEAYSYFPKLLAATHAILEAPIEASSVGSYALGDAGEEIGVLQAYLKYHNYLTDDVTEFFGANTKSAVRNYQTAHNMEANGIINGAMLSTMGFAINAEGIDKSTQSYSNYLQMASFYQKYQQTRDMIGTYRIHPGENYIRNIPAGLQLSYSVSTTIPSIMAQNLDGESTQIFVITCEHNGYRISPKDAPSYSLTANSTSNICFELDQNSSSQRWCIETDKDNCWFSNINFPGKHLSYHISDGAFTLNHTLNHWSCRSVTECNTITPAMKNLGVTIHYTRVTGNESVLDRYYVETEQTYPYFTYYLDYTEPIMEFFRSTHVHCASNHIPTFDLYINENNVDKMLGYIEWMALTAIRCRDFYNQVNDGAPWDIKLRDVWTAAFPTALAFAPAEAPSRVIFNGTFRNAADLGNILYGYTGMLYGFGSEILLWAGGAVAERNRVNRELLANGQTPPPGFVGFVQALGSENVLNAPNGTYADDLNDHYAIKEGIALAENVNWLITSLPNPLVDWSSPILAALNDLLNEMYPPN